jgi:hypothetical protein
MAITVTVNFTQHIATNDPLGIGFVCSEFGGNPVPMVADATWQQNLKNLAPGHVRASLAWYGGNPGYGAGGSSRTPGTATNLINTIKSIGAIPLVSFNGDSADNNFFPNDGGNLVHYFNDNGGQHGGRIQYWSIGNEADNGNNTGPYEAGSGTGNTQGSAIQTANAMFAADNTINIGAPAAAYWDTTFLQWAANNMPHLGTLSYHAYDGGNTNGTGFPTDGQYYNHVHTDLPGMKGGIKYGVEEVNWAGAGYDGSANWYDWHNCNYMADAAGQVLTAGGHFTEYSDSGTALGLMNDGSGKNNQPGQKYTTFPAYWGLGIWTGMNGQFKRWSTYSVSCTNTSTNRQVTSFAQDNGKIVICNNTGSPQALVINMTLAGGATSGTYNIWATNGASPLSAIARQVSNAAFSGGAINYTIAAQTVISVDVTAGGTTGNTVTVNNPGGQNSTSGTAISTLTLTATDSASGQTFTWTQSGLPPGLSIGAGTGQITGTPTSPGTYTVTATATDLTSASGSANFSWSVATPSGNVVTVTNPGPQSNVNGTAISTLQMSATDSQAGQTLTWTQTGLPTGLSIGAANGQITGTPTANGTFSVTVTATDGTAAKGSVSFIWTITPSGGTTPVSLVNDFREGTSGTTITTGNSAGTGENAFDAVTITGGGAAVYSATQSTHSPLSGSFSTVAAGTAFVQWGTSLGAQGTVYGRAYVYLTGAPASNDNIISFANSGTFGGGIMVTTGLVLQLQSATFTQVGTQVLPVNQWIRLEWKIVAGAAGAASATVNYYSSQDSATITSTTTDVTNQYGSAASINQVNFGWTTSHASQPVTYHANLNVNNTGYPGPIQLITLLANNFESGAGTGNTLSISQANSGSAVANAFDGATQTPASPANLPSYFAFQNGFGAHGTGGTGGYFQTGPNAPATACNVFWSTSLGLQTTVYGRAYFLLGSNPSSDDTVIQFLNNGAFGGGIMFTAAGTLAIQSATFAEFFNNITLPIATGNWFRIEWKVVCGAAGTASCTVNLYEVGGTFTSPDSTTPFATITDVTGQYGTGGAINQVSFGWNTPHLSQPPMFIDDAGLSTTGFPGPAGKTGTGTVAPSSIAMPTTGNNASDTLALFYNIFEGGTNGTTITTANSGGASGRAFDFATVTNGSLTFSTTQAAHGTLSAAMSTTVAGGVAWVGWNTFATTNTFYGRCNVFLTANPNVTDAIFQHKGSLGSSAGNIQINTSGQLVGQTPSFANAFTFTSVIPLNTWIRVEWYLAAGIAGVGQLTVNYYNSKDGLQITESHTDQTFAWGGTNGVAEIDWGWTNTHPSQPTMYLDDFDINTTSFLGPAGIFPAGNESMPLMALSGTSTVTATETSTGSVAMQPMTLSGAGGSGRLPLARNPVSGNVINDYGLDTIFYSILYPGTGTMLVAYIGWDIGPQTFTTSGKAPAVNVTDSAGNLWKQAGITTKSGTSRAAIWVCISPRQVQWISVSVTGWAYSTSYTIVEVDNLPGTCTSVSLDFVQTNHTDSAVTTLTVPSGTATTSDLCLGIISTGGSGGILTLPSGWQGIAAVGGALTHEATTYSMYIPTQAAGTVAFAPTWGTAQPASGIIVGLKLNAPAPVQPNPNFPKVVVEAAFGAVPGDWTQSVDYTWDVTGLTWTDLSTRVIGDGTQGKIRVTRGRQYELSQEETGEITIAIDNHDGAFTFGNASSPYYPNVVPGVPIRVTAWWNNIQYPVALGYVERWPQEWPELPQWGFSTIIAVDAYGPLASTTLPSAVEGDIRKDSPYAYFATDEQYSFTTQALSPFKAPIDANGLTATNKAFGNNRVGAYRDGNDQPITTGQALNLLGDSDTVMGATTYAAPETNSSGPGMFYFDPNIPVNGASKGFSIEFWFTWGQGTLGSTTLFNAWAGPSSFYNTVPTYAGTIGGLMSVGVNTGAKTAKSTGFFVNGAEIGTATNFSQNSFTPQHFVMMGGPTTGLYGFSMVCYLNGTGVGITNVLTTLPQIRAITLGPARFSYDVSDICVYNGYNFSAGHLAIYPYELTPVQISNHFATGVNGASGIPAPGRFAQVLTWGLLGLKRGGTAWYGSYGSVENTFMSEAYSTEGSTGADVMSQLVQTEGGRCFVQANGSLIYVMRWWRYNQPPVALFGDNGTSELPFLQESSFSVDNSFIYNSVSGTQSRGPNSTISYSQTDSASQLSYFNRSGLSVQSYALTPFDTYDAVNWAMAKYKQPSQRVQQLSLNVSAGQGKNPAMFATVLGLELNQNIVVNRRPVGGAVMSVTGTIQEIQHDIGPAIWNTKYQIAPTSPENQALIADVTPWSFTVAGTPIFNNYFIVTNAQAASIFVGQQFTDTSNPGVTFTVIPNQFAPGAGFTNVSFAPTASVTMNNPDVITLSSPALNQAGNAYLSWLCVSFFPCLERGTPANFTGSVAVSRVYVSVSCCIIVTAKTFDFSAISQDAISQIILKILSVGAVREVDQAIICRIAIEVTCQHSFGTGTCECFEDELVHFPQFSPAVSVKTYYQVTTLLLPYRLKKRPALA